ncbi:MAG: HAD-IIIA family hydrolase, partial [Clostridiales bacterium]|nr:HAD-IIIA family hydrolase [Clostridiales bacterium]
MAGGKGTRLREITKDEIPKPMAPVAGKPILEWQIEHLREQGVTDVILCIGHLGCKIREHFGDGTGFGVRIQYVEEKTPLGTAGALSMLPPLLEEGPFFLAFGDVLFNIDLERMRRFHLKNNALATLFAHPNSHPFDSDLLICDGEGRVLHFDSKHNTRDYWYHNCVNAGLYLMDRTVCEQVPKDTKVDLEKELLSGLISEGRAVFAYQSPEYVKDVGTVDRIRAAERELTSGYAARRNLKNKQKAIFLDRDGTINRKNDLIYSEEQFELEQNAAEAIREINRSGYLAIVVTNQPVVARGLCGIEDVENIHRKMETLLGREGAFVDAVFFCPHHPDKGYPEENPDYKIPCACRKPKTGMLQAAAERFNIDLSASWMVGDGTMDIQTGVNAGTHTALVLTGDAGKDGKYAVTPELIGDDLLAAVKGIIRMTGS